MEYSVAHACVSMREDNGSDECTVYALKHMLMCFMFLYPCIEVQKSRAEQKGGMRQRTTGRQV